jgi:hypothetical protein
MVLLTKIAAVIAWALVMVMSLAHALELPGKRFFGSVDPAAPCTEWIGVAGPLE